MQTCRAQRAYSIRQRLHAEVAVVGDALGIVRLQDEAAATDLATPRDSVRLGIVNDDLVVDQYDDPLPRDSDGLRPPFVVFRGRFVQPDDVIQTARLYRIAVTDIHLRFIAGVRKAP